MKKVLLFSIFFIISAITVFAYETIIIKFPDGEKWNAVYYKKQGNEAILQYVPEGQTSDNWTRAIIVHSYKDYAYPINIFINNNARKMQKANPTGKYRTIKMKETDAIITRCTDNYNNIQGQCEFFRATYAHEGIITVHYINRNKENFRHNYTVWFDIISGAKFYNSYFRDERMFDKSEYFELW